MLSIGLMSGTSMDGVTAALLNTTGTPDQLTELGYHSLKYDPAFTLLLKSVEYATVQSDAKLDVAKKNFHCFLKQYLNNELRIEKAHAIEDKIAELSAYLSLPPEDLSFDQIILHATFLHGIAVQQLLKKTHYQAKQIQIVGFHGQTLLHRPEQHCSIILGCAQSLANQLGIPVVSHFRENDLVHGGQGAPFAPLYHLALAIRDNKLPLAVINCGGIANITLIPDENELNLIAFDTGPGNNLIDRLIRQRTQGKENIDQDGRYGKRGKVNYPVLTALKAQAVRKSSQNYLTLLAPKSLDVNDLYLIDALNELSIEDAAATLEQFTAETIIDSLQLIPNLTIPPLWILAGGGWHNPVIREQLSLGLKKKYGDHLHIALADEIGWCSEALEAQIFAYFAVRHLKNLALSFPGTTGVCKPISGGKIFFPL